MKNTNDYLGIIHNQIQGLTACTLPSDCLIFVQGIFVDIHLGASVQVEGVVVPPEWMLKDI